MQSLTSHFHLPAPEFTFAGFVWPRWVATLDRDNTPARIAKRTRFVCGPYYHAPRPNASGKGFYLDSDGMPGLRYELTGKSYGFGDSDSIEGLVFRLPHGRGWLAGYTMGQRMSSAVDGDVWADESDAIRAANTAAENAAQEAADFDQSERDRMAEEDRESDLSERD